MVGGQAQSTASIGRHSELIAQTALLANGYTVLEPIVPEPFDLAITRKGDERIKRVQVKTILRRNKSGNDWFVIRGKKNNGGVYTADDCDYFIGVYDNCVYMTPNREISEYWTSVDKAETTWTRLYTTIDSYDSPPTTL